MKYIALKEDDVRNWWQRYSKNIYKDVDGYWVYAPFTYEGCFNEYFLVHMAELLHTVNATWDIQLRKELGNV